jgi:hypothetical protein
MAETAGEENLERLSTRKAKALEEQRTKHGESVVKREQWKTLSVECANF